VKRLEPESNTLPDEVARFIHGKKYHRRGEGFSMFKQYVVGRLTILDSAIQKKNTMEKLKKRLKDIDEGKNYSEQELKERRTILYDEESGRLFISFGEGWQYITLGDIAADYEWGIQYAPDESLPRTLWRRVRKLSDTVEARRSVEKIFDIELAKAERISIGASSVDEEFLEKRFKIEGENMSGYIAEKIARNILRRIQYNNSNLGLVVENSNAVEDTELKYDFKIFLSTKYRGIATKPEEMTREEYIKQKRNLGIQFTTGAISPGKEKKTEKGRKRLHQERYSRLLKRAVDDIIIVHTRRMGAASSFKKWLDEGKPPGGPEQYLSREKKLELLKQVVSGRLELSEAEQEKLIL
jgi:hypothetical protein